MSTDGAYYDCNVAFPKGIVAIAEWPLASSSKNAGAETSSRSENWNLRSIWQRNSNLAEF
jgi:hypothetical protein